jgi:hypothetical protein
MNRVLIGSIALTLALGPAAIASANTVVRTTESGRDVIYVKGLTANQQVTLNTTGGNRAVAVLANNCGIVRVRSTQATPDNININGTDRSIASPDSIASAPTCTGTTPPWTGGTTSNARRDAAGNYYFSGYTPNTAATVLVATTGTRNAVANGCGIARFSEPADGNPWGTGFAFSIAGTSYTLGNVTSQNYPPLCRNVGTSQAPSYVRYEPAI